MPTEVELKLDVTPDAALELESSELFGGEATALSLRAVYFDTPDLDLFKAGISLRIRAEAGTRTQTVKASGGSTAGLFARSEWEREVEDDTPILDDTSPIRSVLGGAADEIAPLFHVRIERRVWSLCENGASIEVAFDRGEIAAGDRSSPVVEIELELKAGEPAALFDLARRMDAIAPVRLGVLSKSERGYRLSEERPAAVKAGLVVLASGMTSAEAFRTIVHACMRQFRLNEALLVQTRHAEALHQARVALRRLRSAFSIFKPLIGEGDGNRLQWELRCLASELGEARNLDVLLGRTGPGALHERIAMAREAAYDQVVAALSDRRARTLMLDLAHWTAAGDWLAADEAAGQRDGGAREFASRALDRVRRKVKRHGRGLEHGDDEMRHEVRKDAKKLRYASEFSRSLFERKPERRRYKKFIAALEELQEQLGALNDLATAPHVLSDLGLADVPGAEALTTDRKPAMIAAAAEAHENLMDTKRFW